MKRLEGKRVLAVGDTILDHYIFVQPKGRAVKDPILSVSYLNEETYAGGILAIANHIATYVKSVTVATLVGDSNPELSLINDTIAKNVTLKTFTKKGSPTIKKTRYIDHHRNHKLFKVEVMNDMPISAELSREVCAYLLKELPRHDLTIVGDFGHGFINQEIRDTLENHAKYLSINIQSNSSNMGYNYVNHYRKPHFITMDEQEIRLPLMMRFEDLDTVMQTFAKAFGHERFLVTIGKQGCAVYNKGTIVKGPAFTNQVVDTIGAGDAVFSLTSLFSQENATPDMLAFIGNCAGALKTQYQGNKESVTKEKFMTFLEGFKDTSHL